MAEKKRPEFNIHFTASEELDKFAKDFAKIRGRLQDLAETLATNADHGDEVFVYAEHVQAAERLFASDPTRLASLAPGHGIFLSYSNKDEDFARELADDLRQVGVKSFLAPLSIKPGTSWLEEIWQAIRGCRALVLVATAEAVKSKWCLLEIGAALGLGKPIIAVLRHSARLPDVLKTVQAVKVQTKEQQAGLVEELRKLCALGPIS